VIIFLEHAFNTVYPNCKRVIKIINIIKYHNLDDFADNGDCDGYEVNAIVIYPYKTKEKKGHLLKNYQLSTDCDIKVNYMASPLYKALIK